MTPGILRIPVKHLRIEATITPDGWQCASNRVLAWLEAIAPIPATEAGEPFCLAFQRAVREFGGEVVQEPEADVWQGIGGKSDGV